MAKAKCKICRNVFEKRNIKHIVCSYDCLKIYIEKQQEKKWKERKKKMESNLKTKSDIENDLQPKINEIARLIDKEYPCMMCGNPLLKRINGCHYHSVGSNPSLRFNLFNIWAGCHSCNGEKGGNINGYDIQLIKTYGKEFWEWIKFDMAKETPSLHLSKPELEEIYTLSLSIIRDLKKRDFVYTLQERIQVRKEINALLGIYNDNVPL